jgi:hypothetical protein
MARVTLKQVNAAIAARGGKEVLVKGEGYFYFADGDAYEWDSDGVYVYTLNELPLERWIEEWESRRDAYGARKQKDVGIAEKERSAVDSEAPQNDARDGDSRKEHDDLNPARAASGSDVSDDARAQCEMAEMNDLELTMKAARAAGIPMRAGTPGEFNPLHDSHDAFNLMLELRIMVGQVTETMWEATAPRGIAMREAVVDGDFKAAVRRAIVRAAADLHDDGI